MIPHHRAYFCCCTCFGIKIPNVTTRFDQIHQLFHKLLSINIILKSTKGHNSVEKFGKIMCIRHNMDHISMHKQNFIKIHSLFLKFEILKPIQGPQLLKSSGKFHVLVTIVHLGGWVGLGWAMVLGSFQCLGALLLLHIVGQGHAVLAADAGRVGFIFYIFHLSSLSDVLSFGRWLNMTEILWFWLLNPNGSCQLLPRTSSLSTG